MTQCHSLGVLAYASPDVKTSPPRTLARMGFAVARWFGGQIFRAVRLTVLTSGYAVLALSVIVRSLLGAIAMTLLYLGGLRWERVKARSMRVAHWIDRKTLRAVQFLRAPLASRA